MAFPEEFRTSWSLRARPCPAHPEHASGRAATGPAPDRRPEHHPRPSTCEAGLCSSSRPWRLVAAATARPEPAWRPCPGHASSSSGTSGGSASGRRRKGHGRDWGRGPRRRQMAATTTSRSRILPAKETTTSTGAPYATPSSSVMGPADTRGWTSAGRPASPAARTFQHRGFAQGPDHDPLGLHERLRPRLGDAGPAGATARRRRGRLVHRGRGPLAPASTW
jgi:hypothetical protein